MKKLGHLETSSHSIHVQCQAEGFSLRALVDTGYIISMRNGAGTAGQCPACFHGSTGIIMLFRQDLSIRQIADGRGVDASSYRTMRITVYKCRTNLWIRVQPTASAVKLNCTRYD
ncbi:hypothetical protein AAFF_G00033390 [Aldrovandia affinis]|uniref:Uncharacterized protein n=1 Tax=Aldrovandia affinis TaxID=143900 RepID=A0AAD7WGQ8_9TELE|nr:hypothetical protein AAFF_G00033390 [Aldrovandia affinis]